MTDDMINVPDLPADAPEYAKVLDARMRNIEAIHLKILGIVEEIKPEVSSVIESLRKNPMFKMLLGGK